jgi:O-antigen/teichoic acid export membrane protein
LFFISPWISTNWLKIEKLNSKDVSLILILMSFSLGFQFPFSLYSNGLLGLNKQFTLNIIIILGNILRHLIGVFIVLKYNNLIYFFSAQALLSIGLTLISRALLWGNLQSNYSPKINFLILSKVLNFSLGMALTTIVSVIMANADRIILSKMVLLSEVGIYSIAFTATGLLQLIIQPFYRTFYPLYSESVVSKTDAEIHKQYFDSTKLFSILFFPISLSAFFFAPHLFEFWLGKENEQTILIFRLLIIGITLSGLTWLPVAFQQANGWSTLHFKIISLALIIGIPVSIIMIKAFGSVGASTLWLIHGVLDFTVCIWLMHKKLLVGKYLSWLKNSIIFEFIISFVVTYLFYLLMPQFQNLYNKVLYIIFSGSMSLLLTFFFSGFSLSNLFIYKELPK